MPSGSGVLIYSFNVLQWVPLILMVVDDPSLRIPYLHDHLSSVIPSVHCKEKYQSGMSTPHGTLSAARRALRF